MQGDSDIMLASAKRKWAFVFVLMAATLWGTIGFYSKALNGFGFDTLQVVFIRAFGASIALIVFLLLKDRNLLKIEFRDSKYFVGTGILSFVFFNWCYFISMNRTSLSVAAILLYTAPAFVMVLSAILFKERMTGKKITSLILTFVGCILVSGLVRIAGHKVDLIGILAGLGSGLGYALYSIFGRYALKKYNSLTVTVYTFIFASICLIPITDIKGMAGLFERSNSIYYAAALGLFATVAPFILYTKGLSNLETGTSSILATLEPVVATIVGITLFGESMTLLKVLGIALVILAVSIIRVKNEDSVLEKQQ